MKVRAGLLSGGFRQILAIAVAVVREPHLLLLDEPSAGLAPKVAESVFQGVRRWKEESESAVLIVEQNVRGAFSVANRVVVLAEGVNVLESTDPSTLLSSGILDTLFLGTSRYGTFAACKRREESNE
jgi:branched-chain amino acid transport system ATP-binding protein